ncbi:hypothetical protein PG299_10055, partial [Riemerella anatipestifer]|nr:hypothetical protein [Riemerella anatipestifer]
MSIHFPKGEGIKIIKQASEASVNDTIYILPIDERYAELIIVDKVGNKRKIGFKLPENIALTDTINDKDEITSEGNVYLKKQIDKFLSELKEKDKNLDEGLIEANENIKNHTDDKNNPHEVTAEQIGLGNVDNTSDENKPISKAQKIVNDGILETISNEAQERKQKDTDLENEIRNRLPKTTSTISSPTEEYKYIYLTNEANETRRMLAGDLGKNLANSKPNNTPNSGINLVTPWYIDTNGIPLFIRGLPDKSNDATFNKMRVQDAHGQEAWSNGKVLFNNIPDIM